jgi:Rhodopirellula transposase DDE domain
VGSLRCGGRLGLRRSTINRGLKELAEDLDPALRQVRRPGGGRKSLVECDEQLIEALLALVEPTERGDPESSLRWTCKSLRRLAVELCAQGHRISHTVVGELLKTLNFSLQANSKTREGDGHPDRDAQFRYVNRVVKTALNKQQPVISVDTKKKELVGDFKNGGREWRPKGQPEKVRVHDFLIKELGRAVPYGVYDRAADAGWVCVGIISRSACLKGIPRMSDVIEPSPNAGCRAFVPTAGSKQAHGSRRWSSPERPWPSRQWSARTWHWLTRAWQRSHPKQLPQRPASA